MVHNTRTSESNSVQPTAPKAPRRYARKYVDGVPRYVWACENQSWHLALINRVTGECLGPSYQCKTWRHAGKCRMHAGAVLWRRTMDALEDWEPRDIAVMTLTLNHKAWKNPEEAYRELFKVWRLFAQAHKREFGRAQGFVSVVEMHPRSGMPHLNVVMVHPEFARLLGPCRRVEVSPGEWRWKLVSPLGKRTLRVMRKLAVRAGFGWSCVASRVISKQAAAGYAVKVANRAVGEVTKPGQLPVNAPPGFRRHRSSRRFLPPVHKSEEWTGKLVLRKAPPPLLEQLKVIDDRRLGDEDWVRYWDSARGE